LAPTVGIAATGFGIRAGSFKLFHRRYQQIFSTSSRSTNFAAANSSSQIASANSSASDRLHHQQRRVHQASRLRSRQKFSALASEPTKVIVNEQAIFIKSKNQGSISTKRIIQ
jgi:7-keto-8-aminopelargonate synthetase-like enzyme